MPSVATCPDLSRYQQLAAGSLTEADEVALLAHLEHCEACARKLNGLNEPDALASLLRQARTSRNEAEQGRVARLIARLSKLRPGDTSALQRDETQIPDTILPCPSCGRPIKVKPEWTGQQVRCPLCQHVVRVPAGSAEASRAGNQTSPWLNPAARGVATVAYQPAGKQSFDFLAPPQAPDEIGRLGGYRVLDVLGAGGMGVVFRAEDLQLARPVALKTMLPSLAANESAQQRFLREARAAAALRHDHIVIIHQVGEDRGVPFLAMEFLNGEPLDVRLAREGKLPVAEVLRIGREIALGLAAAHKRNLIHRDIKPANIWLEAETGRVKILDFGLARASGEGTQLTQHGAILGTPAYMAPEQARGKTLDQRCDLFSLGCVLYRMATGKPAFQGTDIFSTLLAVTTEEPPAPRQLDAALPAALSDLIVKLLAKEPEDRPASAQAVAEALQEVGRTLSQPPVSVVPSERPTIGQPAPRRKRFFLVGVAACVLFVLLAGLLAGIVLRVQTRDGTIVLQDLPADAEVLVNGNKVKLKLAGNGKVYEVHVTPGKQTLTIKAPGFAMETKDVTLAAGDRKAFRVHLQPLAAAAAKTPVPSKKGDAPPKLLGGRKPSAALEAMRREQIAPEALKIAGNGDPKRAPASLVGVLGEAVPMQTARVSRLAFSPDGRWLASASFDKTVLLREVSTGRIRRALQGHTGPVSSVVFSKDGQTLVSASHDGTVKLWPATGEGEPQTLLPKCGPIEALAASSDGRFLAAGARNGAIKLWKWGTWEQPLDLPPNPAMVRDLAFSPDGELLATARTASRAGTDGQVWLYRSSDGKLAQAWLADKGKLSIHALAFHPNGKWLATTGQDRHVKLWEVASGKLLGQRGDWTEWSTLAFHPKGKILYACLAGTNGHLLDLPAMKLADAKGRKIGFLEYGVVASAFSPDGKFLAAGNVAGVVHIWDTTTWEKRFPQNRHSHYVTSLAIGLDGRTILSTGDDDALRRWDLGQPQKSQLLHWFDRTLGEVALSPDGKKYITTAGWVYFDADQRGRVWDAVTGKQLFRTAPPTGGSFAPAFSPDSKTFAGISHHSPHLHLWDANNGKELHRFPKVPNASPAFSADGKLLATAGGKVLKVWDVASGDERHALEDDLPIVTLTLSPDGQRYAAGHADGTISFWNVAGKDRKKRTLSGHTAQVNVLRFTPDGKTLISCSDDGTIRLWNPEHGRSLRELIELGTATYPPEYYGGLRPMGQSANRRLVIELDPSGKYLFAAGASPLIYVLRLPSAGSQASLEKRRE